ncbi:MAG: NAD(P)/FAD-dependent oxidoreductase [Candidatus Firestonebacteria bacterium]|nr:NAD(P)/FAD-dependent oxidoreductase [Candidatus Firestonebacteria bacterium]
MDQIDITIIGAGVVGLAVARTLSATGRSVAVLERHSTSGQETSSRNSEVIHAGIYYPTGSLKAALCVEGAGLLYDYCRQYRIAHQALGKVIVAVDPDELAGLETLRRTGEANGVQGLKMLDQNEVRALEPQVSAVAGLFSPHTGIISAHEFMETLAAEAQANGALLTHGAEVTGVEKNGNRYRVTIRRENFTFDTQAVVNCAGLSSDQVAAWPGLVDPAYRLHWCKGDYFRVVCPLPVRHLVYPVVSGQAHGLGIHLTLDLAGQARFGPDVAYVDNLEYAVDAGKRDLFARAIRRYLPMLQPEDLTPDTSGIRPKLQGPQDGFRDFVIRHEIDRGFPGLINLVGIESPGLTASLAIARKVGALVEDVFR